MKKSMVSVILVSLIFLASAACVPPGHRRPFRGPLVPKRPPRLQSDYVHKAVTPVGSILFKLLG